MSGKRPGPELRRSAEILFEATIKADELRFDETPENAVEFTGDADGESSSGSVREGLPDNVRKDVTYRDVRIDYAIAAKLRPGPDGPGDGETS
ncbi:MULTISPECIES: hypothetical protein [Thermomonosporaceae]|uniref:hypothetical protein n=1 Tax=Thermomonosporaceae TaxID=2012 RepID=UPI00255AA7C3|nr:MULTISPECIES: hypothetical protein [Thermomonosporaceae]MDL4774956.1 hypothetical protein [Actinomadura xylanilytica]